MRNNLINKTVFILSLFAIIFYSAEMSWANRKSQAASTDYVVEYSLLGLKDSAQKMADRNAWLASQIAQMNDQIPALQQRLSILDGQREKYQLLSGDNLTSRMLRKNLGENINQVSHLKGQAELYEEQRILEEKIKLKEIENQSFKEIKSQLQEEVDKHQYELSLLDAELKDVDKRKDEWRELVRHKEQSLKRLRNAERSLGQLNGKFMKPQEQIKILEQDQKNLQQRLGELENTLNISLNQENNLRQEILNVRGLHAQKMTQLNQEVEQLKLKQKEMQETISKARTKIDEKKIQLTTAKYSDYDLKRSLDLITEENMALKGEMNSLKENLSKIESLK